MVFQQIVLTFQLKLFPNEILSLNLLLLHVPPFFTINFVVGLLCSRNGLPCGKIQIDQIIIILLMIFEQNQINIEEDCLHLSNMLRMDSFSLAKQDKEKQRSTSKKRSRLPESLTRKRKHHPKFQIPIQSKMNSRVNMLQSQFARPTKHQPFISSLKPELKAKENVTSKVLWEMQLLNNKKKPSFETLRIQEKPASMKVTESKIIDSEKKSTTFQQQSKIIRPQASTFTQEKTEEKPPSRIEMSQQRNQTRVHFTEESENISIAQKEIEGSSINRQLLEESSYYNMMMSAMGNKYTEKICQTYLQAIKKK